MNPWLAALALVTALDLPQRVRWLGSWSGARRITVAAGLVIAVVGLAGVATPLLDAVDVSAPTLSVGAGMVLVLWSVIAVLRWEPSPATPDTALSGLMPGLFPWLVTPVVGAVALAVGARNGFVVPLVVVAVAAVVVGVPGTDRVIATRAARRLSATVGIVVAIAMMADGVLSV
ncbi:hypothetical protein BH24ACT5_BH24ACT5_22560 [soil metagenome]